MDNPDTIVVFSKKFIVPIPLVEAYVTHLQNLKILQDIRSREHQAKLDLAMKKEYKDYNRSELVTGGGIGKLLVFEIEKYLKHDNLPLDATNLKMTRYSNHSCISITR